MQIFDHKSYDRWSNASDLGRPAAPPKLTSFWTTGHSLLPTAMMKKSEMDGRCGGEVIDDGCPTDVTVRFMPEGRRKRL